MNTPQVSSETSLLQVDKITAWISNTYWAQGRTEVQMQKIISNSLNYGLYLEGEQIGYARLVTDEVVFAYLMDVYIDKAYRGNGYAHLLMKAILADPRLTAVSVWRLATTDAHSLYKQYGFTALASPEKMMERMVKP